MRVFWFSLPALIVVTALFLFMAQLTLPGKRYQTDDRAALSQNILRLRFDSEVQLRERRLLPPPPPDPQTDVSRVEQNIQPPLMQPLPDVSAMNIDSLSFEGMSGIVNTLPTIPTVAVPAAVSADLSLDLTQRPHQRINPQYPRRALQRKVEGHVVVEFIVDAMGQVEPDSLVFVEAVPEGTFERAVRSSLLKWRFTPLMQNGSGVRFKSRQRFKFSLDN